MVVVVVVVMMMMVMVMMMMMMMIIIIIIAANTTQHSLCARHCPKHFSQLINSSQQPHEACTFVCSACRYGSRPQKVK